LRWGKSETQASVDDLKRRANETQEAWNSRFEEAKRKAVEKGEDIKQRVGETEEEFRNRIAEAIQKR
jgi:transketolase